MRCDLDGMYKWLIWFAHKKGSQETEAAMVKPRVDHPPQILRPFPRRRGRSLRPAPDGHPPLPPGVTLIEGERPAKAFCGHSDSGFP